MDRNLQTEIVQVACSAAGPWRVTPTCCAASTILHHERAVHPEHSIRVLRILQVMSNFLLCRLHCLDGPQDREEPTSRYAMEMERARRLKPRGVSLLQAHIHEPAPLLNGPTLSLCLGRKPQLGCSLTAQLSRAVAAIVSCWMQQGVAAAVVSARPSLSTCQYCC